MNTELFQHEDFGDIRMKQVDGKPWFVAKDLCHALDMSNVHDATKELNPSEKGFDSIDIAGSGGREAVLIVSESGLYQIILKKLNDEVSKSRKAILKINERLEKIDRLAAHLVMRRPDYPDFLTPAP